MKTEARGTSSKKNFLRVACAAACVASGISLPALSQGGRAGVELPKAEAQGAGELGVGTKSPYTASMASKQVPAVADLSSPIPGKALGAPATPALTGRTAEKLDRSK